MNSEGREKQEARLWGLLDHTPRSIVVACVVVVLAAACGSTVPQAEEIAAVEGDQGLDAALPPGAEINSEGQIVNEQGEVIGTTSGGLTTGGDLTGSDSRLPPATSGSTSVSAGANGPGVTDRSITLGFYYSADLEAGKKAVGMDAIAASDGKRIWDALVKYQNERGGIAGRRIVPVYWNLEATASSRTWPQQEQEACAKWTQDNSISAALTVVLSSNILECLQDAGAALVSVDWANTLSTTALHRQYPYYVEPVALTLDRGADAMVRGLYDMRYFVKQAKLGLVTYDDPRFRYAIENGLMPALRDRGISLVDAAYLHLPESLQEYGQLSSDAANAALRFKSQGIDHVVFVDKGGNAAQFFMQAAERQDYHPRYGLSSQSLNQALADLLGGDARSQLHGALSIGWYPVGDTREAQDPDRNNPTRALCFSIMQEAGVATNSTFQKTGALKSCDALWSVAAALDGASVINQSRYLSGMYGLRGGYSPGTVWSTYINRGQHDGVSSVAKLRFVDSCGCFKYLTRPYPIE